MSAKVLGSKHEANKGQYTFRWVIGKTTGDAEQASIEIIANAAELPTMVGLAYNLADTRMFQQNQRYLESLELEKDLPPEVMAKVHRIIERVHGRTPMEDRLSHPDLPREDESDGEAQ
jgi:hypothetical protein